jgi:hypothetical protein
MKNRLDPLSKAGKIKGREDLNAAKLEESQEKG